MNDKPTLGHAAFYPDARAPAPPIEAGNVPSNLAPTKDNMRLRIARLEQALAFCDGAFQVIELTKDFNLDGVKEARRRIAATVRS